MKLSEIKLNPDNPRTISKEKLEKLKGSIEGFQQMMALRPIIIDDNNVILGGNMRYKALLELGYKEVPDEWIKRASDLTEEQKREFAIKDNVGFGEWDWEEIEEWNWSELEDWGLDMPEWGEEEVLEAEERTKTLSERFIVPPFSVLDTKQGYWQDRKNWWLSLGIKSELGREAVISENRNNTKWEEYYREQKKMSIFDPVLCELAYKWFNVPNGKILDCFAGGSVRGIVAAKLGYEYLGNDLRSEQIEANRINAKEVLKDAEVYPTWMCGDSLHIDTIAKLYEADLLFSCPPYADLEVYSDAKEDISNMPYNDFLSVYREIIRKSCQLLKNDRFAVFVVGDVRDKKGFYQNFVSDTIQAFIDSGLMLYNEMVLLNSVGNAGMRASKTFNGGRKVIKVHQNVLVFYKGNPKNIKANYPELDLSYMNEVDINMI